MEIKVIENCGWNGAIQGMRFPMNSDENYDSDGWCLGPDDIRLLASLTRAGTAHRKTLRMLHIQAKVNMPLQWWSQMDTYKVATTSNSRSKMHKFGERNVTCHDYQFDEWTTENNLLLEMINNHLENYRDLKAKHPIEAKKHWRAALQLNPESYLQERMIDFSYETMMNIMHDRWSAKLDVEWRFFMTEIANQCPYVWFLWMIATGDKEVSDIIGVLGEHARNKKAIPAHVLDDMGRDYARKKGYAI